MARDSDEVRSAASALREAAAAFSRALTDVGVQAGRELADELKAVTDDINDAAVVIGLQFGGGEPRRSPKAERTRSELLAAARRVFAEKGYEGASVGDVAAAAGYTKGAVYANFGSKEELLVALARDVLADDAALKNVPVALDLTEVFAAGEESDERHQQTLLGLELYLYAIRHPEARADLAPLFAAGYDGVAALVHRSRPGAAEGSADAAGEPEAPRGGEPTRDDRDLAFALVALHTLGGIVGPLMPGPEETAATVRRLVERLLRA